MMHVGVVCRRGGKHCFSSVMYGSGCKNFLLLSKSFIYVYFSFNFFWYLEFIILNQTSDWYCIEKFFFLNVICLPGVRRGWRYRTSKLLHIISPFFPHFLKICHPPQSLKKKKKRNGIEYL